MKLKASAFILACLLGSNLAQAEEAQSSSSGKQPAIMTGKPALACNILLCLSNQIGTSLPECAAPLKAYYDTKPSKRQKLLDKCPKG